MALSPSKNVDKLSTTIIGISVIVGLLLAISLIIGFITVGSVSIIPFGLVCIFSTIQVLLVLVAMIYFARRYKTRKAKAVLPLAVNISILVIAILLYQTLPEFELGFRWRLSGYTKVVALVQSGQIKPNENHVATLPPEYQYLSDTGQIWIYDEDGVLSIVFFDSMGILGEFTGYVYRSNNMAPTWKDIGCDGAWPVKTGIPNWFYCDSE
jgi:hypothetical protein